MPQPVTLIQLILTLLHLATHRLIELLLFGRCRSSFFPLSSHHHITSRWSNLHTYDVFHFLCVIFLLVRRCTSHKYREQRTVKPSSRNRSIEEERQVSSDFFSALHRKSSLKDKVGEKQVDAFLEMPLAKSLPTKNSCPSKAFQQLFYNTIQYCPSIL